MSSSLLDILSNTCRQTHTGKNITDDLLPFGAGRWSSSCITQFDMSCIIHLYTRHDYLSTFMFQKDEFEINRVVLRCQLFDDWMSKEGSVYLQMHHQKHSDIHHKYQTVDRKPKRISVNRLDLCKMSENSEHKLGHFTKVQIICAWNPAGGI